VKPIRNFVLLILIAGVFVGCGSPKPTDVVARVSGEPIFVEDLIQAIYREGEKFGPEVLKDKKRFQQIKNQLLEDLIQKKILVKEALAQGVLVSEEELEGEIKKYKSRYTERDFQEILETRKINYPAWREVKRQNLIIAHFLTEKLFKNLEVPEEKIREYYDQHLEEFTNPESVHARQIVTDTKEKAEAILKRLKEGENFAKLALELSISPDRMQGGDLGFIPRGSFPKEFDICFELKEGELSPVVSGLYGFHIFKVIEKRPEKRLSFEEARDQIKNWLMERAREDALQTYYTELRKKYPVEVKSWILKRVTLS
jgi:peptidyl-prolyl cis-trans isomerase C